MLCSMCSSTGNMQIFFVLMSTIQGLVQVTFSWKTNGKKQPIINIKRFVYVQQLDAHIYYKKYGLWFAISNNSTIRNGNINSCSVVTGQRRSLIDYCKLYAYKFRDYLHECNLQIFWTFSRQLPVSSNVDLNVFFI